MGLDLVGLRRIVWSGAGYDSDNEEELPREQIDLALNQAFWELQDKFNFKEKEKTGTFPTVAGVSRYDMPQPFEALKGLYIVNPDTLKHSELVQISPDVYESNYNESVDNWGFPVAYVRILEGCAVRLAPTPLDAYTITIKRTITLQDISDSNTAPDIPQAWHELIGWGGLWRVLISPVGDLNRAHSIKNMVVAQMNSMIPTDIKEKQANTRYAGLEVIGHEYDQEYDTGNLR